MSETQNCSGEEEGRSTPDILVSDSDASFFRSLRDFIEHELRYLRCPEDGPDELRYFVYRSVFNKVIARATAYKRLLLTIKAEYDDVIRALQRRREEDRAAQWTLEASTSHLVTLVTCQRRAAHLRDRTSVLQRDTADLQQQLRRRTCDAQRSTWTPGLTLAESEDPDALDEHLKQLEARRDALLDGRRHCVSLQDDTTEQLRDELRAQHQSLRQLHQRRLFLLERVSYWENEGQPVPLENLLSSTLENFSELVETDAGARCIDAELFEHEEPTGADECRVLQEHLDRFVQLLDSQQYDEAALLAAREEGGVLRNTHTMQLFEGVTGPPGSAPPALLFFQALLTTVPAGAELPAALSLQAVRRALQLGATQLVTHAVAHNKLAFSEELGDVLTEHAQKNPAAADACLVAASACYEACGPHRKAALSMCRRGLIHCAADFMRHRQGLTAEDCLWVVCRSPSLSLLQLLTEPRGRQAAILPVGVALLALLGRRRQQLGLQLLDSFVSRGPGGLEEVILEDSGSSVDVWTDVASVCSELKRADLSRAVRAVLLDHSGTSVLSPDLEGARLMEHVFL